MLFCCLVAAGEFSLTIPPLLLGLMLALVVEMLEDSSEADVVFVDVFKMDASLFTVAVDAVWRVVAVLETSPLVPAIVPFSGVWFKNDILAFRFCSTTEDAVLDDLLVAVSTFWKWSL